MTFYSLVTRAISPLSCYLTSAQLLTLFATNYYSLTCQRWISQTLHYPGSHHISGIGRTTSLATIKNPSLSLLNRVFPRVQFSAHYYSYSTFCLLEKSFIVMVFIITAMLTIFKYIQFAGQIPPDYLVILMCQ